MGIFKNHFEQHGLEVAYKNHYIVVKVTEE
jgi:hypothetical protein